MKFCTTINDISQQRTGIFFLLRCSRIVLSFHGVANSGVNRVGNRNTEVLNL